MTKSAGPTMTVALPGDARTVRSSQPTFVLHVAAGPDAGQRFALHGALPSRALIGTSPACTVRLTDAAVSRRHAAFAVTAGRLHLTDLGSTNGSFVNGLAIVDVYLDGGEFVRLGNTELHIQKTGEGTQESISSGTCFGKLIGSSEEMRRLYPLCARLAESDVPVVIEGQTGTGKEVLAESIHEMGPRADGPLVVFDCTTIPPNLAESELFGHEKGAFTGAITSHAGVFEQAHEGTLLIDEIGDLDILLQPKLLRAIQRKEVRRIGSNRVIKVDVRVLAATRRDLDREVQEGRFRDDLFYRLNVARIELPPLKDRRGDVSLLAQHFWSELGGKSRVMPPSLLDQFEAYDWPGNVRELYNTVARHLALGDLAQFNRAERAGRDHPTGPGSDFILEVLAMNLPLPEARQRVLDEFERRYLERVLEQHGGNVTRAATAAGVGRRYLHAIKARQRGPSS